MSCYVLCNVEAVGTFSVVSKQLALSALSRWLCIQMFVSFNMWKSYCMRMCSVLIFPLAWLTMCCRDNSLTGTFSIALLFVCMNVCVIRYVKIYYVYACTWCAYLSFSTIKLTMNCGDNFASCTFKGYLILLLSVMVDLNTLLMGSILY